MLRLRLPPTALLRRAFATSAAPREHFLNATPAQFESVVANGDDRVVLVDFYAEWCGPCKVLTPVLKSVISPNKTLGGADLMTIDTDAHFELAAKFKIASLPTVVAFRNGKQVGKFVGSRTENGVLDFLTSLPVKSL